MNDNYLRITLNERKHIEQSLKVDKSLSKIANELGRSRSTVSREVQRNSVFMKTGSFGKIFNNCVNRHSCSKTNLCDNDSCRLKYCRECKLCCSICKEYAREHCPRLDSPPYCCNGCDKLRKCTLEKAFYKAGAAHKSAGELLRLTRSGINITEQERKRLDEIVSPLIKRGQSPYHICENNKDALMISDKTLYKYISANLFSATATDLLRKVKMKPRKAKPQIKIEKGCYVGRTYRDFLAYMERYPDTEVVQMDSVIGAKGISEKVLLTIHFPMSQLLLAYIRGANTARSVTEVFERLKSTLNFNDFEEIFPLILTDRGSEFSAPSVIERDSDICWTNIFYCDPNCAYQKASIENNHRFIRMILPKGASFSPFTQDDINLMMCHINSYKRKSLGGQSPIEVFAQAHGNTIIKKLGLKPIQANEVILNPCLLKRNR
jgi:IS30 family transposase